MRSMVEGVLGVRNRPAPSTTAFGGGPPPRKRGGAYCYCATGALCPTSSRPIR